VARPVGISRCAGPAAVMVPVKTSPMQVRNLPAAVAIASSSVRSSSPQTTLDRLHGGDPVRSHCDSWQAKKLSRHPSRERIG
jgi:hypothetical protein